MRKYPALLVGLLASLLYISHANAAVYDVTLFPDLTVFRPNTTVFTFENALAPGGDGTLTATAFGDLDGPGEDVEVFAETFGGTSLGILLDIPGCGECGDARTDTILISQTWLEQFAADELINFAFAIHPDNGASFVRYHSINLTYPLEAGEHQNGPPVSAVPLPATLPLLLSALVGLWGFSRWRRT